MVTNGIYKDVYLICWRGFRNFTLRENIHRVMSMKTFIITFLTVLFCLNSYVVLGKDIVGEMKCVVKNKI